MASNRSSTFYFLSLLVALLTVSLAEGRLSLAAAIGRRQLPAPQAPRCNDVYGAKQGDTCFAVAQKSNLTPAQFSAINPNLDCDKVFIGQWLCIKGTTA